MLTIARRELFDLVVKVCRVRGLDAGTADLVARNVVAAEVSTGQGTEQLIDVLGQQDVTLSSSVFVWAPDRVIEAELDARRNGVDVTRLTARQPIPWAAVAATVGEAAARGVDVGVDVTVDPTINPDANDGRSGEPASQSEHSPSSTLQIDPQHFEMLRRIAARFLVPEADVDALG